MHYFITSFYLQIIMLQNIQTIELTDGIEKRSHQPLKWSKCEDSSRIAIIVKSGIYILTINPVPVNASPTLNTRPLFIANQDSRAL